MNDTFKAYLDQQKADNKYMTAPSMELLGENIFDNRKYDCYSVSIDFTSEYMVKTLTNMLINDYKTAEPNANTDSSVKSLISLGSEKFNEKLREKLYDMIVETVKATKQLRTFFGLGKDSSALAAIQTEGDNGTTLKYIFFRASKKSPKAYAERFRDEVGRNPKISMLKKGMDIEEETYYKQDIKKARKDNIFINIESNKDKIMNDSFMTGIVSKLQDKVKGELKDVDEKAERGNLISVYSVPFKVDDALIKETAQNTQNIDEFYTKLVGKINDELVTALKQVSKIDDYIGFIPTKSYGFNLYFKDKDTATDFAEKINQEGEGKVNERKRYEKKMSKLFQLLDKNSDLSSLSTPTNSAVDFFRGTLFARTHVAELIKEKFPSAEDQLVIYQYIVKYDNDELKNFLHTFNFDSSIDEINNKVKEKLQDVLDNLQKIYNDEIVTMSSEGTNLVFFFRKNAMIDSVKARIAEAMSCEMNKIKVTKTAMTAKEVKSFKENINNLEDLTSFYKAVENYIKPILDKKKEEASEQEKENRSKLATNLVIKFDHEKFYNLPINDILSDGAFNLLRNELMESFKNKFKTGLMKHINLLDEDKNVYASSDFINRIHKWWTSNEKKGTIKDYLENCDDSIRTKEITLAAGLLASYWEHFAIYLKNIIIQKAGKEQADKEFEFKVTDDSLIMYASARVGKYLTGVLKNPKSFANVINKTIKGSDSIALEFSKPEGIE